MQEPSHRPGAGVGQFVQKVRRPCILYITVNTILIVITIVITYYSFIIVT